MKGEIVMLFVLSKEKILSYIVAFSTVAILIGVSAISTTKNNTIETSSKVQKNENAFKTNNLVNME